MSTRHDDPHVLPAPGAPRPPAAPRHTKSLLTNFSHSATARATLRHPSDDAGWQRLFATAGPGGITVRGAGASYSDAALNDGGTVAVTTNQPKLLTWDKEHGRIDVDAGVTLGQVLAFCLPQGWSLPVLPGTANATVAGALAADVHGKNHVVSGSFSHCVQHIDLLCPGQGLLRVGPEEQPDVFWATVGGMGLTGVILRLRLQLRRVGTSWLRTTDTACKDLGELLDTMTLQGRDHEYVVAWVDGHARAGGTGRGVVSTADHLELSELPTRLRGRATGYAPRCFRLGLPPTLNLVRPALVRAYNSFRCVRAARKPREQVTDFAHAFQPLDAITDWPVLFGRKGLVQYQFSVPTGREDVLRSVLRLVAATDCPPALATLKAMGPGSLGHLSFPAPGWTLALDFPATALDRNPGLLTELDELVLEADGRIYLAKDSRMPRALVPRMYPRLDEWRELRDRLDPEGLMTSDLDRRLNLSGHHEGERS